MREIPTPRVRSSPEDLEYLVAAIQSRARYCMDASDLHACREQLLADMKTHEFVECEVATRADRNLPEP